MAGHTSNVTSAFVMYMYIIPNSKYLDYFLTDKACIYKIQKPILLSIINSEDKD